MNKQDKLLEEAARLRELINSPGYKEILAPFLAEQKEEALRAAFESSNHKEEYRLQGRWQAIDFIERYITTTIKAAERLRAKEIEKATKQNKLREGLDVRRK